MTVEQKEFVDYRIKQVRSMYELDVTTLGVEAATKELCKRFKKEIVVEVIKAFNQESKKNQFTRKMNSVVK